MSNHFLSFLQMSGQKFSVERDGIVIAQHDGLANHEKATGKQYVGFMPETDVKTGDWLINSLNNRLYVKDVIAAFFQGAPHQLKAFYLTEAEFKAEKPRGNTSIFNIGTAYGSIIGTQNVATLNYNDGLQQMKDQIDASDSADKEELKQIVALLEMIVQENVPASKGILSKFSAVMERNSWITGSIAATLLSWLTTQIH